MVVEKVQVYAGVDTHRAHSYTHKQHSHTHHTHTDSIKLITISKQKQQVLNTEKNENEKKKCQQQNSNLRKGTCISPPNQPPLNLVDMPMIRKALGNE